MCKVRSILRFLEKNPSIIFIAVHPKATSDVFIPVYCSRRHRDSPERFFRRDSPPRGGGGGGPRRRSRSRPRSLHMQKVWYHQSIHSRFLTIMNWTRQYPNSLTNDRDMSVYIHRSPTIWNPLAAAGRTRGTTAEGTGADIETDKNRIPSFHPWNEILEVMLFFRIGPSK